MSDSEPLKREAALAAVGHVRPGMRLGLGSGSTAKYAILELGRLVREGALSGLVGVPTSLESERLAREAGVPLAELDSPLDLAIDGADEVTPGLDLIKGLGGALVREKIVARQASAFIVVADASKRVARLGEKAPVPVELIPFGATVAVRELEGLGATVAYREREGRRFVSDNGNLVADCSFGVIADPPGLERELRGIPGVVGTGLFLGMAALAYFAGPNGVERLER